MTDRTRSRSTIERLPIASVRHLYREHVCSPRTEAKDDMVSVLWRSFQDGKNAAGFWQDVRKEWEHVESLKKPAAKQLNYGGFVREFHPEQE